MVKWGRKSPQKSSFLLLNIQEGHVALYRSQGSEFIGRESVFNIISDIYMPPGETNQY